MTDAEAYEELFKEINTQLESHQIIVKKELIVYASVIDTPLCPKAKTTDKVTQNRSDQEVSVKKRVCRLRR